jgi:RHS repeat-associated protein
LLGFVTLLALVSSPHLASAYYDPGVQRWINRDPISERGFQRLLSRISGSLNTPQLYSFVANSPVTSADLFGLTIWRCSRRTSGPPFGGFGRHSYLWDDRSPIAAGNHSCGLESGYSVGATSGPTDAGPIGNEGSGPEYSSGDVECYPVPGSQGNENSIMQYCRNHVNNQPNCPGLYDCHSATCRMLRDLGYQIPPTRRLNDDDLKMPPDYGFPSNAIFW